MLEFIREDPIITAIIIVWFLALFFDFIAWIGKKFYGG